ncbi:PEBP-like protein [Karstenula rhodostoma CBS 690.94]|uniref:PEBP-like protein n=1 Tax=Karstenula rhodostoma CBS 690.94 TaxID=1392251 RepID=A0A9P4PHV4_9PLEO|nr:PEBP-like protein [Karstenula rhodostoma CBS 690.94]
MVNWVFGAALAGVASATVAPGFPVKGSPDLNVTWANNNVSPTGELLSLADTAEAPSQISAPVWTQGGHAVLMLVDLDVPRNNTRVQLLHWLTANVTMPSTDTQTLKLEDPSKDLAPYRRPSPPLHDIPHKYTLLLFAQPENFTVPARFKSLLQSRVGWDTAAFVNATGLGNALAADWIRVQNTGNETLNATASSSATSTASSAPTSTSTDYTGMAGAVEPRAWMGAALVAGLMAVLL